MILLSILALMLILLTVIIVVTVSAVGATGIVVFGDVIVCIVFIVLLMRFIIKRRNK